MLLKCQENSYLKEFSSTVVSCENTKINVLFNGKKIDQDGYAVILENTILFPEGGGQPCDHGFLNDQQVYYVERKNNNAVHYVEKPFQAGEVVKQVVDWKRRFDQMQQHSGQHLITAVIEKELGFPTLSWWLGEDVSHVELDTPLMTQEQIQKVENLINQLIRENRKVTVDVYEDEIPEDILQTVRSRGLPVDHKGSVRIVNIEGVEGNMCCGTHVSNLSQLQMVKLLHVEKSKRKDKIFLYFLVGNRVLNTLAANIDREQRLTTLLKNNPSEHPKLVEKLIINSKMSLKNLQNVLKELAIFEAEKFKNISPQPKYYFLYKKEAEIDFMNTFMREIGGSVSTFFFLSVGDEKGEGNILISGNENDVSALGTEICNLLCGKGHGQKNKYQAKVTKMVNRRKAEKLIEDHFAL